MQSFGRYLLILGLAIAVVGAIVMFLPRTGILGRLPGDFEIKRENFSFYLPVVTSIVLSIVLTLVFWLINYFTRK